MALGSAATPTDPASARFFRMNSRSFARTLQCAVGGQQDARQPLGARTSACGPLESADRTPGRTFARFFPRPRRRGLGEATIREILRPPFETFPPPRPKAPRVGCSLFAIGRASIGPGWGPTAAGARLPGHSSLVGPRDAPITLVEQGRLHLGKRVGNSHIGIIRSFTRGVLRCFPTWGDPSSAENLGHDSALLGGTCRDKPVISGQGRTGPGYPELPSRQ